MTDPTVYLIIGPSAITRDDSGEIVETVYWYDGGTPDWRSATICDHRGAGGTRGFSALDLALTAAETNAKICGLKINRLPVT